VLTGAWMQHMASMMAKPSLTLPPGLLM